MNTQRLLLAIASVALVTAGQALPGQPVLAATPKPSHPVVAVPSPVKDEHVKLAPGTGKAVRSRAGLASQEPSRVLGRGGLQGPETPRTSSAFANGDPSIQFLTRPYTTWHDITSAFDHCNPDYSVDGKVCRFDGSVGYKSNGVDPGFSLGYAQTRGGGDYLYYDGHNGWDYSMNYENILAAADGVVRIAGADSINPCFGQTITVDHLNGYTTRYAHLSKIYVSSGQSVSRAQVIGQTGNTGCSSGPHLHFGVYATSSWTAVDPWGWSGAPGADPWPSDAGNLWLTGYAQFPLPGAPSGVTAIPGVNSALVSWSPPAFDGGSSLTSYSVTASPGGASVSVPGSATSAVVLGLTNGVSYTFTVTAINAVSSGASSATSNAVTPNAPATFYFAEGTTAPGFGETLSILSPNQAGVAAIDYYTGSGHTTASATYAAGKVTQVDVNAAVGAGQDVSVKVTLPSQGIVERSLHFNTSAWHGSTSQVGASQPSTEWDFAEGSTLPEFNEYLTLQNPNSTAVSINLNYFTSTGAHPVKSLTLPAQSRTTVEVFRGDAGSSVSSCIPNGAAGNCGVGRNLEGVSVQVKSTSLPVVAERSFYVNTFSFGWGLIKGGHDAFGANAAATQWNFAEGTTLPGFTEYLALQNPGASPTNVTLTYLDGAGTKTVRTVAVPASSRFTVSVFQATYGVGPNVGAVSVQVNADQPIVAERPMYMVHNFGSGVVASAHVGVGSTTLNKLFGFAAGSTLASNHEFLTIQNTGATSANVTTTYYTDGGPLTKTFVVNASSRHTVQVFDSTEGAGSGSSTLGIVVSSDQPILVEKATYDTNPATYGATDSLGYVSAGF